MVRRKARLAFKRNLVSFTPSSYKNVSACTSHPVQHTHSISSLPQRSPPSSCASAYHRQHLRSTGQRANQSSFKAQLYPDLVRACGKRRGHKYLVEGKKSALGPGIGWTHEWKWALVASRRQDSAPAVSFTCGSHLSYLESPQHTLEEAKTAGTGSSRRVDRTGMRG